MRWARVRTREAGKANERMSRIESVSECGVEHIFIFYTHTHQHASNTPIPDFVCILWMRVHCTTICPYWRLCVFVCFISLAIENIHTNRCIEVGSYNTDERRKKSTMHGVRIFIMRKPLYIEKKKQHTHFLFRLSTHTFHVSNRKY